ASPAVPIRPRPLTGRRSNLLQRRSGMRSSTLKPRPIGATMPAPAQAVRPGGDDMVESSTPILIGCGDVTDMTTPVEKGRSPFDLIAQAGRKALEDTGAAAAVAKAIDTVAMLRLFSDTSHRFATRLGTSANPPKSVAKRLGIDASRYLYTWNGGN